MCVGIPAQVVALGPPERHVATVDVEGVQRDVNTIMVDDDGLAVGEWVLLHVGFAMSKIDEKEAAETLAFMRELGSVYDDEVEARIADLRREAGDDLDKQIQRAWQLALSRPPTKTEHSKAKIFVQEESLAQLCRVIFNLNEFVYPD